MSFFNHTSQLTELRFIQLFYGKKGTLSFTFKSREFYGSPPLKLRGETSVTDPDPVYLGHTNPDPVKTGFGFGISVHKQTLVIINFSRYVILS